MSKNKLNILLLIISGLLSGLSIYHLNFWLIWFALIPFFIVFPTKSIRQSILYGGIFGLVQGSILLYWIIEGAARFSGAETFLGIPIFLLAVVYYSGYFILFAILYSHLQKRDKAFSLVITALIAASVWIVFEWLKMNVFLGIPWVKDTLAISQIKSLYGIQLASITGQWGISFVIIIVNVLFASAMKNKNLKQVVPAFMLILLFYVSGLFIYTINDKDASAEVKVAIIQENIKAESRWDESTGDAFAKRFFDLNREAVSHNPDLIVWSETALPWTYSSNDDLIAAALKITKKSQALHIIGILSEAETASDKVYNSAYCINPEGGVIARYDKVNLLSFIEAPLISPDLKVPFLSEGIFTNIISGSSYEPIKSSIASLGLLICNESLTPYEAKKSVDRGANLLINISNDAWLENTHLIDQHFYVDRLRAVETGVGMIINSNRGHAGYISGRGVIRDKNKSEQARCIITTASIAQNTSIYHKFGDWLIYLNILFIIYLKIKTNVL